MRTACGAGSKPHFRLGQSRIRQIRAGSPAAGCEVPSAFATPDCRLPTVRGSMLRGQQTVPDVHKVPRYLLIDREAVLWCCPVIELSPG